MIEVTEWARDIIARSHAAATRFNPDAKIRIARTSTGVEAMLADRVQDSDRELRVDDVTVWVEDGLEGLLDVEEPHDRLVLRPLGSAPNPRGEH